MDQVSPPLPEYAIPIDKRRSRTVGTLIRGLAFGLVFDTGLIMINGFQFLCLPLAILPTTRGWYHKGIRFSEHAFGVLLVFVCQVFAPTTFRVTYDSTDIEGTDREWIQQDPKTGQIALNWPKKVVMIANHQVYSDWLYIWCLSYFVGMEAHVVIVLKKSLKWVPIVGWGMQFFDFIFLSRSWAADRAVLTSKLSSLAAHHLTTTAERADEDEPLNFLLFPEGTLVSPLTYPVSKKYAERMNLEHPEHMLLPRSTGLHTTLLALSQLPSLYLMDVTIGYPGIPRGGFGQSYYTLRSIFMDGIPPPEIIYHVRLYNVQKEVPLRATMVSNNASLEKKKDAAEELAKNPHLLEASDEDKKVFDQWLRDRWMEKEAYLESWLQRGGSGPFVTGSQVQEVVIPVKLRSNWEAFEGFTWFIPAIVGLGSWFALR